MYFQTNMTLMSTIHPLPCIRAKLIHQITDQCQQVVNHKLLTHNSLIIRQPWSKTFRAEQSMFLGLAWDIVPRCRSIINMMVTGKDGKSSQQLLLVYIFETE